MNFRTRASGHQEGGQSLVEFAVSLTLILLLLSGAVSFGMAYFSYVAIADAAQEGALYGSFDPANIAAIRLRVRTASTNPVNLASTDEVPDNYILALPTTGNACEGLTLINGAPTPNAIRVTVKYDYKIFMPFLGAILGRQTIPLTASATDTILEPRCP